MKKEYIVIKTHNFDPETEATKFDDYRKATAYLHWVWENYYNDAMADDDYEDDDISHLDKNECYHEEDYAKVQWDNGDYTEFNLMAITPPHVNFPTDWEKYVIE